MLNSLKFLTAQNPLFIIFSLNFVMSHNHYKLSSRYQINEEHISDGINTFHNDDYINPTAMTQIFRVSKDSTLKP